MTVTILPKTEPTPEYITPDKCIDGKAYKDLEGSIYICNSYAFDTREDVKLFSVCGKHILFKGASVLVKEINLEIREV